MQTDSADLICGVLSLSAWLYLLLARDGYWRRRETDGILAPRPARFPPVIAVVPARNEADAIRASVGSLLAQHYAGEFRIVVVDDESADGTGEIARSLRSDQLTVISGQPRPKGWAGKVWAMQQGLARALDGSHPAPAFLWFTDADITHAPDTLATLVARAEAGAGLALVSLMARLACDTPAERCLIPAFVYFFGMLYPFAAVNDPRRRTAAAAGGCVLVRCEALRRAGGLEPMRGALIDDCALARLLKPQGPLWLGLTDRSRSQRRYARLPDIRRMVVRSAYTQLRHSPVLLAGTLLALALIFVAPPVLAIFGGGPARLVGGLAWLAMALSFQPMLRFYRRSPAWGMALPVIAAVYAVFTFDSAMQSWTGQGGLWKGRTSPPNRIS